MAYARYNKQKICEHCGNEYTAARSTSQFCGDKCRVKFHRQLKKSVALPQIVASEAIRSIGALTEGVMSYEAIIALKNLQKTVAFYDVSRPDSWWRCQKCWQAVQKVIPVDGDCSCGKCENARWQLQKRLI